MDSVGLGQSFKEECENCKKLQTEVDYLKSEIATIGVVLCNAETRIDEFEDEKQAIIDDPEPPYNWRDDVD